jgi:hypothetical protein
LDWLDINTYESLRIEWDYDILLSICFELISVSSLRWKILLCWVVHCGSILKKKLKFQWRHMLLIGSIS